MNLQGIYAPVPTSFGEDGAVLEGLFRANLQKWAKSSLDGIVVCGSNGELPFTTIDERATLTSIARDVLDRVDRDGQRGRKPRKNVLTGAFMQTTQDTMTCCAAAADAGADAVLLLPPHYFKGQGAPGIVRFFDDAADASPIPIVLYNMPANTCVDMDVETVMALAAHPNIIGIKDTSGNITKLANIAARANSADITNGFSVFCGSASYFLPALSIGAVGGTLAVANLYPESCRELMNLYRDGRVLDALLLQRLLLIANDALISRFGVPGLKSAMDRAGLYGGPCRPPLLPLDDESRQKLFAILDRLRDASLDSREKWRLP
ncbi:MAG: dihydrodipicolinate synthase family protein [Synergistaceae bacterium]|nr:dihydrodipicolinate synthase family protein [Synergistaceae bacterium]